MDFAWRALHGTTEVGKQVAASVYGARHRAAYFLGCSQGGRQGLDAAQRHPGLFQHMARWLVEVGLDLGGAAVGTAQWGAMGWMGWATGLSSIRGVVFRIWRRWRVGWKGWRRGCA